MAPGQHPLLFADRVFFGLVAAWLVIRTGGLESAIALHVVGNVLGFTLLTTYGELATFLTGEEDATPVEAAADVGAMLLAAALIARAADRSGIARRGTAEPAE